MYFLLFSPAGKHVFKTRSRVSNYLFLSFILFHNVPDTNIYFSLSLPSLSLSIYIYICVCVCVCVCMYVCVCMCINIHVHSVRNLFYNLKMYIFTDRNSATIIRKIVFLFGIVLFNV